MKNKKISKKRSQKIKNKKAQRYAILELLEGRACFIEYDEK
jgi:hypothetical protein